MSSEYDFIIRIWGNVRRQIGNQVPRQRLLHRIEQTLRFGTNVREAIHHLYAVDGMKDFSLRLLWLLERNSKHQLDDESVDAEVSALVGLLPLAETLNVEGEPQEAGDAESLLAEIAVHAETLKRDATLTVRHEAAVAMQGAMVRLAATLRRVNRMLAAELAAQCALFIHWAQHHLLRPDDKVVAILNTTNITLQNSWVLGEYECHEPICRTLDVLRNPERVFGSQSASTYEIHG